MALIFKKTTDTDRFELLSFIAKASSNAKYSSPYSNVIRVECNAEYYSFAATDSKMMNWTTNVKKEDFLEFQELMDCDYVNLRIVSMNQNDIILEKADNDMYYPNWKSVLESLSSEMDEEEITLFFPKKNSQAFSIEYYKLCQRGVCIDMEYLKRLADIPLSITVSKNKDRIKINNGIRNSMIATLKIKEL